VELNTELSQKGLKWLSSIKGSSVSQGLTTFFTKNGDFFAEINDNNNVIYRALLSKRVKGEIEFSMLIQKYFSALRSCTTSTYSINVLPNSIEINSGSKVKASLFGGKGSITIFNEQELENAREEDIDIKAIFPKVKKYFNFIDTDSPYNSLFLGEGVFSFNRKVAIKNISLFSSISPVLLTPNIFSSLRDFYEDGTLKVIHYKTGHIFKNEGNFIYVSRNKQYEDSFTKNVVSLPIQSNVESFFKIDPEEVSQVIVDYSYFLKENHDTLILDIANKKIIIETCSDIVELPLKVITEYPFTIKKINSSYFLRLVSDSILGEDKLLTIKSNVEPNAYLYIENGNEYIAFAPMRVE